MSVVDHSLEWPLGRIRLPGLDADRSYRVEIAEPSVRSIAKDGTPAWVAEGVVLSGRALAQIGIATPNLAADRLVLIRATAI